MRKLKDNEYLVTHENGENYKNYENILTKPLNEMKKNTIDLEIYILNI